MYLNQCFHILALTFMVIKSDTAHSLDMSALGWWIRWEQCLEHGSVSYAITTCISCELHLHRESGLGLAGRWCGFCIWIIVPELFNATGPEILWAAIPTPEVQIFNAGGSNLQRRSWLRKIAKELSTPEVCCVCIASFTNQDINPNSNAGG